MVLKCCKIIDMIKVLTVFGTRPEAIKMAPVVLELSKHPDLIESVVCVTAQHREMLDQVLNIFKIKPDYDLNLMKRNQTLATITTSVLNGIQDIIEKEQPSVVLVHGDTTTTFATALAAFYKQVKIGHVEAGLRTYDKYSPFPEEINREFVSLVSDFNFAPTKLAANNLEREGKNSETITITGNTAIDALSTTVHENYSNPIFKWLGDSRLILLTAHRRENLGEPMRRIFRAIRKVVETVPNVKVVYPVHLNPKVREVANEILDGCENIKLIEPLEVVDFHNFMNKAKIILTDSGGIQEEAPSLGKPVLVLRDTTERPEGIRAKTLRLVGTNEEKIFNSTLELLTNANAYSEMAEASNPYGDGHAAERIVRTLIEKLG